MTAGAGQIVATGVGGAAAGLATGAAIAATVPVAGWIVGGALIAASGVTALVQGIAAGKANRAQAAAWAKRLGLPDADEVPRFVVRLRKMDRAKRAKLRERYARRLARQRQQLQKWRARPGGRRVLQVLTLGIMRGPARLQKAAERNRSKIGLIDALGEVERERRQGQQRGGALTAPPRLSGQAAPPAAPDAAPTAEGMMGSVAAVPTWAWVAGALAAAGLIWYSTQGDSTPSRSR